MSAAANVFPAESEFLNQAKQYPVVAVHMDVLADTETPISVYRKLVGSGEGFLLESVEGGARLGRYSFIGCGTMLRLQETAQTTTVSGQPDIIAAVAREARTKTAPAADTLTLPGSVFDAIKAATAACRMPADPSLPRFTGGLTGYVGFEASHHLYDIGGQQPTIGQPTTGDAVPNVDLLAPELLVAFDHVRQQVQLIAPVFIGGDAKTAYAAAVTRLQEAAAKLANGGQTEQPAPSRAGYAVPNQTRAEFEEKVQKVQDVIAAGEADQIVLSLRMTAPHNGDPFDVYRRLRSLNPSPYMFYFSLGEVQIAGASPEMLVRVDDGIVEVRPIAGTRPRGATTADDARLAADLLQDRKERSEHVMLVDLAQAEVSEVSVPGSVFVENFMYVENYSHVMHLVSDVKGKLQDGHDAVDAMTASFPAGTVSGAPKQRALSAIAEHEPHRGVYAGAVGYFGFQGNLDTCIAIRTVVFTGGEARVQAGAGIVAESVPAKEYDECMHKARAMLQALGAEIAPTVPEEVTA